MLLVSSLACASGTRVYSRGDTNLFIDTQKPNALWTLPAFDSTMLPRTRPPRYPFAPDDPGLDVFLRGLQQHYDVRVVRVGAEEEVYRALDTTPDLSLWVLSGHGDGFSAKLGRGAHERTSIDVGDRELSGHTRTLLSDAVVYLDTCDAGTDRLAAWNLANAVAAYTGRVVYSSDATLRWEWVTVTSWYPFSIRAAGFMRDWSGRYRDATYIAHP